MKQKEHTIKPEQDSKVEKKPHLLLPLMLCDVRNSTNESTVSTCVMLLPSLNKCNEETFSQKNSLQQQMLAIRKNRFT